MDSTFQVPIEVANACRAIRYSRTQAKKQYAFAIVLMPEARESDLRQLRKGLKMSLVMTFHKKKPLSDEYTRTKSEERAQRLKNLE